MWVAFIPSMDQRTDALPRRSVPSNAGQVIHAWRAGAGLTQEDLAHELRVTFSTISRWENGHVLPSKLAWFVLQRLAIERGYPLELGSSSTATREAARP